MIELSEETAAKVAELQNENDQLEASKQGKYVELGKTYYHKPERYEETLRELVADMDSLHKKQHENYMQILNLKGLRLCPNCESEVEPGAVFCGECGTRMEKVKVTTGEAVICSRCGAENEKNKKFCVICGQKLEHGAEQEQPYQTEPQAEKALEQEEPKESTKQAAQEVGAVEAAEKAESEELTIQCKNCGQMLPSDAIFCEECGVRVQA